MVKRVIRRSAPAPVKARPVSKLTTKSAPVKKTSKVGLMTGSAGFQRAKEKREIQEAEYQKQKDTPYALKLQPGESAEVIILDDKPPVFVSLHKVKNSKGWWVDEVCIADTGRSCPLCESLGKEGSFTMVLTCLDRRPYTVKKGPNAGKTIRVSKKLLHVKGRNLPKFQRLYKGKAKGNFRGIKLTTHRGGDKESSMGEDLEFGARVSEDLLKKFGENSVPADYAKIYTIPSPEDLKKRYKIGAGGKIAGSEDFEEGEDDYDTGDVGWGK